MKEFILRGWALVAVLGVVAACSDDPTGSGGNGGSGGSSSSAGGMSSSSTSSAGGMSSSSSAGGGGAGGGMLINGCDEKTADDRTADAAVTISFAGAFAYTPKCIRVRAGTPVTWDGNFATHPLVGGTAGLPPVPDVQSPIQYTNSGTSVTFTIDTAGTYPYYCEAHQPSMAGAIFAE